MGLLFKIVGQLLVLALGLVFLLGGGICSVMNVAALVQTQSATGDAYLFLTGALVVAITFSLIGWDMVVEQLRYQKSKPSDNKPK